MKNIAAEQHKCLNDALAKVVQNQVSRMEPLKFAYTYRTQITYGNNWNNQDNIRVGNQTDYQIIHGGQTFTL